MQNHSVKPKSTSSLEKRQKNLISRIQNTSKLPARAILPRMRGENGADSAESFDFDQKRSNDDADSDALFNDDDDDAVAAEQDSDEDGDGDGSAENAAGNKKNEGEDAAKKFRLEWKNR